MICNRTTIYREICAATLALCASFTVPSMLQAADPTPWAFVMQASGQADATGTTEPFQAAREEPLTVVEEGPLVTKTHDVQQLLKHGADTEELIYLITNTVLVTSWSDVGGSGTISVNEDNGQMSVMNVASVQKAVARLLTVVEAVGRERQRQSEKPPSPNYQSIDLLQFHPDRPFRQLLRLYVVPTLLFADASQRDSHLADYDSLIALTTRAVEPNSWDSVGGPGSVTPWRHGNLLAIVQSPQAHNRIDTLFRHLSRLPGINSKWDPDSLNPIELPEAINVIGIEAGGLKSKSILYPVHDLLPLETKPAFSVSPRSIGLHQLKSWLLTNAKASPLDFTVVRNNAALLITSDNRTAVHKDVSQLLSTLRDRKKLAETQSERESLAKEIFPAVFLGGDGRHEVYLFGTCDADQQLAQVARSDASITRARLIVTDVSDKGIKELANSLTLSSLTIWSKNVTNAGVAPLSDLMLLQRLTIRGKQITDDVAGAIAKIPSLSFIDVSNTSITDECLPQLVQGRQWLILDVSHTKVTPAGVESLRKGHPHIMVRHN